MTYDVRKMELAETKSMIRYFLKADVEFLIGMGVDKDKLPDEATWFSLLEEDFARSIEQKQFYYLVWTKDDVPIGHCNINKIEFGKRAFMHLHIWQHEFRQSGVATKLLTSSIKHFFEQFELRELCCEPYARNPAPNNALPKAGFSFVKTHDTTPGWIAYHQPVNRWEIRREEFFRSPITDDGKLTNNQDSMPASYIHGTSTDEQARLAALNRLTNDRFVEFLDIKPQMHVLEVGSGLGLLAVDVAGAANDVSVVGIEKSRDQIDAAQPAPSVTYVEGDARQLEFPDECFDLTYSRYLLEHIRDPTSALKEMRRVTKRNGRVVSCENDISLVRLDPVCPAFQTVWGKFQEFQSRLGGNARVGRSLFRLFREAGFQEIKLSIQPEVHWHGSQGFTTWIDNLIGNVKGVQQQMVKAGLCSEAMVISAIQELKGLRNDPNASSWFVWNRAVAFR